MSHQPCPPVGVKVDVGAKGEGAGEVGWADLSGPCALRAWLLPHTKGELLRGVFVLFCSAWKQENGLARFSRKTEFHVVCC